MQTCTHQIYCEHIYMEIAFLGSIIAEFEYEIMAELRYKNQHQHRWGVNNQFEINFQLKRTDFANL